MPFRPALIPTVVMLVCLVIQVNLGLWQWKRHVAQEARLAHIEARLADAPQTEDALDRPADTLHWHTAILRGRFDGPERLVAGRFEFGEPGYEVVQPFATAGGRRLLVSRGWIPAADAPATLAAVAPEGDVTVEGLLVTIDGDPGVTPFPADDTHPERWPMETASFLGVGTARIGPPYAAIAASAGDVLPVLLVVGPQRARGVRPPREPLPVSGYVAQPKVIGHLSYTGQWFLIAGVMVCVWGWAGYRRGVALRDASPD